MTSIGQRHVNSRIVTSGLMKAIVYDRYGSVEHLRVADLKLPRPKPDQLLVKVHATSVNPIDWKVRKGMLKLITGFKFPRVVGSDLAGEVIAVGLQVTQFQPGDAIFTFLDPRVGGACAEYAVVPAATACAQPTNMTATEAAAVPIAALTALQALRDLGQVGAGSKVLIHGASGGVGTFAVQIAKVLNTEVAAVCGTRNLDLVRTLGADRVIDYTQQDFTQLGDSYDLVFDAVAKASFRHCAQVLKPAGIYVTTLPKLEDILWSLPGKVLPVKRSKIALAQPRASDLAQLKEWIEAGQVRSIIDRTYPLEELVEAHQYSEAGHAVGKIVLSVLQS